MPDQGMPGVIEVPPDLESAGALLQVQAGAITDRLGILRSQLAPLVEVWTGQAAVHYQEKQQMWEAAALGLFGPTGVLTQIALATNLAWDNYDQAELSNIQTWRH